MITCPLCVLTYALQATWPKAANRRRSPVPNERCVVRIGQRCVEATIRLREMFRTSALGWRGLPALRSLSLELGPHGEARTIGEQARSGRALPCRCFEAICICPTMALDSQFACKTPGRNAQVPA